MTTILNDAQTDTQTGHRATARPLPAFANGWYAVATTSALAPGTRLEKMWLGRTITAERTHSGTARVRDLDTHETGGILFAYHNNADHSPAWQLPNLEPDTSHGAWSPLRTKTWALSTHPQEVHENAPDLAHLRSLHGFVISDYEASADGPKFHSSYRSSKPGGIFGIGNNTLDLDIHGYIMGLGFAVTNVHVVQWGLDFRMLTLTTPTAPGKLDLTIALGLAPLPPDAPRNTLARILPRRVLSRLLLHGSAVEVERDVSIWENKTYLERPKLGGNDGPILAYRRWAAQFYG